MTLGFLLRIAITIDEEKSSSVFSDSWKETEN